MKKFLLLSIKSLLIGVFVLTPFNALADKSTSTPLNNKIIDTQVKEHIERLNEAIANLETADNPVNTTVVDFYRGVVTLRLFSSDAKALSNRIRMLSANSESSSMCYNPTLCFMAIKRLSNDSGYAMSSNDGGPEWHIRLAATLIDCGNDIGDYCEQIIDNFHFHPVWYEPGECTHSMCTNVPCLKGQGPLVEGQEYC